MHAVRRPPRPAARSQVPSSQLTVIECHHLQVVDPIVARDPYDQILGTHDQNLAAPRPSSHKTLDMSKDAQDTSSNKEKKSTKHKKLKRISDQSTQLADINKGLSFHLMASSVLTQREQVS